jgi:hypothetical protein
MTRRADQWIRDVEGGERVDRMRGGFACACIALAATASWARAEEPQAAPAGFVDDTQAAASPGRAGGDFALTAEAGYLGSDPEYTLRLAYFALPWLGMEATLAHNPSGSDHAILHYVNAVARLDRPGHLRPFVTAGLGTIEVFPGTAINAAPVTKLLLNAGAGTHLHLRDDVALRVEARSFTILDQQEGHRGAYQYLEWSCGVTFRRQLHTPETSETGAQP